MFLLLSLFVVVVLGFVVSKYFQYQKHVKSVPFPGPTPLPFVGNIPQIAGKPSLWIVAVDWHHQYGNLIQIFLLHYRWVVIGPQEELVKDFFTNKVYIKGRLTNDFADVGGKTGMVFSDGESWARVRKTCAGTFNISHLRMFIDPMNSCIQVLTKFLHEKSSTASKIQSVDIDEIFMLTTLDIIAKTMFSVELHSLENGKSELSQAVGVYLIESFKQVVNPLEHFNPFCTARRKKAAKFIREFMEKILTQRIKDRSTTTNYESKDFLDLLFDANHPDTGVGLTSEELRDQAVTFLIAGHETTAHSLTFAVACIAQHPHVAKLVYEEIDAVIGKSPTGMMSYEDTQNLPYLTAVIKESMRMYPVAPSAVRELDEDHTISGQVIAKGTTVAVNTIALHYNPKVWKDPYTFDPSRFLKTDSESNTISYAAFVPFGHGHRSCIGQHFAMLEMRTLLPAILHKFQFRMFPMEAVNPIQHLTLRPNHGLKMIVSERTK